MFVSFIKSRRCRKEVPWNNAFITSESENANLFYPFEFLTFYMILFALLLYTRALFPTLYF